MSAETVYDRYIHGLRVRVEATDLIALSLPFSCFACCPLTFEGAIGAEQFARIYFPRETNPDDGQPPLGLHDEIPAYVEALIALDRDQDIDLWDREFAPSVEGVRSVLVYDLRSRPDAPSPSQTGPPLF